jgi:SRSO17 transposase
MDRRFRARLDDLVNDAEVHSDLLRGVAARLEGFVRPFVETLGSDARGRNATVYVRGLLSNLGAKTAEGIAYLHDQGRQGLQKFIGQADWDHEPLLAELTRQVGAELGEPDGVLVFDPSTFPKKGDASVGVQRQWCGRLGKLENCQVGVYLAYVSRREHALADVRLYLPEEWTRSRKRMRAAGVPRGVRFRTRHRLILDMPDGRGGRLPHAWVSGDGELGRSSWLRQQLHRRGGVPAGRPAEHVGPGPNRRGAVRGPGSVPEGPVRPSGPVARGLVQALAERRPSDTAELAVAVRERQPDGTWKHDYLLSNAPLDTPLGEFARVFKARNRVEECLKRAKGEAGLADYQVRTWEGWHHHQALSLVAAWFLTQEARRGKKDDPGADRAAGPAGDRTGAAPAPGVRPPGPHRPGHDPSAAAERGGAVLPLPTTQTPAAPAA